MTIRKQTRTWKQRDGTKIRICDMSDGHLCNTIRMLMRAADIVLLEAAKIPPVFNGEMAQLAADEEFMRLAMTDVRDLVEEAWPELLLEVERRGLNVEPVGE